MGMMPFIAALGRGSSGGGHTPINDMWTDRTSPIYGDSVVAGFNATAYELGWPRLLQVAKDDAGDNSLGVPGQYVTTDIAGCGAGNIFSASTIAYYNASSHAYCFFCWGTNDIGANLLDVVNPTTYKASLAALVDHAVNVKGWPAAKIVLVTPYWMSDDTLENSFIGSGDPCDQAATPVLRSTFDAFCDAVRELAAEQHTVLGDIANAFYDHADPASLLADAVHPNDAGHAFIADYFTNLDYSPQ